MNLNTLLSNKSLKAKEKSVQLASAILNGFTEQDALIEASKVSKDSVKAVLIEALEFVSRQQPSKCSEHVFDFAVSCLDSKSGRIKWEAAKVIANLAVFFPRKIEKAVPLLLLNTADTGTVVRWSAAKALGAIIQLNQPINKTLLAEIDQIMLTENKRSIVKVYLEALRELEKKGGLQ